MTTVAVSPATQRIEGDVQAGIREAYHYREHRIEHWVRLGHWLPLGAPEAFTSLDAACTYIDQLYSGTCVAHVVGLQTHNLGRAEKASAIRTRVSEGKARRRRGGRWL